MYSLWVQHCNELHIYTIHTSITRMLLHDPRGAIFVFAFLINTHFSGIRPIISDHQFINNDHFAFAIRRS